MTIYINDSPAQAQLVMKAIKLMKHADFENMAMVIEWFRSQGKLDSRAKVTSKVLFEAVSVIEKNLKPHIAEISDTQEKN